MNFIEASILKASEESLQLVIQSKLIDNIVHQGLLRHYFAFHCQYHLEVSKVLESQFIRNFVIYDWVVLEVFTREHPLLGADLVDEGELLDLCGQYSFQ